MFYFFQKFINSRSATYKNTLKNHLDGGLNAKWGVLTLIMAYLSLRRGSWRSFCHSDYQIWHPKDGIPTDRNGIIGVKDGIISTNYGIMSDTDGGRDDNCVIVGGKSGV